MQVGELNERRNGLERETPRQDQRRARGHILILNQAFFPDVVATAQVSSDLARALVEEGYQVTAIVSRRAYDNPEHRFPAREDWNGVRILRVGSTGLGKASRWRRAVDFASFFLTCAWRVLRTPRADLVIALTSPPLISVLGALLVPWKARHLLFWSMDLNPDEAIAAGWLAPHSPVARVLAALQLFSMKRARRIVVLDRFMRDRLTAKGLEAEKIEVVPPWPHDDRIAFDASGREAFRAEHGLAGKFVVMYSGNHSPCHPLETLISAAERLADRSDIVFCFVGGGSEFRRLRQFSSRMANVLCLEYQPFDRLAASLSAADLQVVVMGNPFVGILHPCKVYNAMAIGAPVLYVGPTQSHVADISSGCAGRVTILSAEHGEVDRVVAHILSAARLRERSTLGVPDEYSRHHLVRRFLSVVSSALHSR